jgi:probable HAF family extracellular repeat protein
MVGLGILPGNVSSEAWGVSGDGSVVVGYSRNSVNHYEAFRWTGGGGMERLWDVLVDHGVDPATDGWTNLTYASGISADGRTIVGTGVRNGNSEAFAAFIPSAPDLPGDFNFDGSVDAADYVVWRKTDSTPDGYNTWRSNFGRTSGSGLAASEGPIPEPSSSILLTLSVPAILGRRKYPQICSEKGVRNLFCQKMAQKSLLKFAAECATLVPAIVYSLFENLIEAMSFDSPWSVARVRALAVQWNPCDWRLVARINRCKSPAFCAVLAALFAGMDGRSARDGAQYSGVLHAKCGTPFPRAIPTSCPPTSWHNGARNPSCKTLWFAKTAHYCAGQA